MTDAGTRAERPRIGVTGPDRAGMPAWLFTRLCLARAGARAVHVTPSRPIDPASIDGLVIGGGADVTWPLVHEPGEPKRRRRRFAFVRPIDEAIAIFVLALRFVVGLRARRLDGPRDALELSLLEHARSNDVPVLGICRGAQLMNVAEGGTLLWNLKTLYVERPELRTVLPRRDVAIEVGSRLFRVLGTDRLRVNSLHQHAVGDPGPGMRIVARETSGVAQAIEHAARRFWIGVQWHPEYVPQDARHQRLFRALVRASAAARAARAP